MIGTSLRGSRFAAVILASLASFGGVRIANAQGATGDAAAAQAPVPWKSQCIGPSRAEAPECSMEQRLVLEGSGQFLARLMIRMPATSTTSVYLIQVPLGVSLPAGLRMSVDGSPGELLGFQTCDAAGCYVGDLLPQSQLSAMKAGKTLSISFEDNAKRPIKLDFSLQGFSKSFRDISTP